MTKTHKTQIINLSFFLILVITLPVLALVIFFGVTVLIHEANIYWTLPLIIFPVLLLGGVLFTMRGLMKAMGSNTLLLRRKFIVPSVLYSSVLMLSIVSITFVGYFFWNLRNDNPPDFFPFDDPDATYTVTKHGDNYMILYESTSNRNIHRVCDIENGERECRDEVNRWVEVIIGKSHTELEPLVGKSVQVNGDFVTSTKQCIASKCHDIGRWAVLNIHSIDSK